MPVDRITRWSKKFDPAIIARRFAQVGNIASIKWGNIVPAQVRTEQAIMDKLRDMNVPEEQWPYYIGLVKEIEIDYTKFTSNVLVSEAELVKTEYEDRLLDPNVLKEIIGIAAQIQNEVSGESTADKSVSNIWTIEETEPIQTFIDVASADAAYVSIEPEFLAGLKARADNGIVDWAKCEVVSYAVYKEYPIR